MTTGKSPGKLVRFHIIGKTNLDVKSSLKFLTKKKIASLDKALKVIKEAGLNVNVNVAIELLDELKRLRKLCLALGKTQEKN